MKYILRTSILVVLMIFGLSSCLESNLDDLPAFSDAEITRVRFDYRWFDENEQQMQKITLQTDCVIDSDAGTATCNITVPSTKNEFTDAIRSEVSLNNLTGYVDLSTAAIITPNPGSPTLGVTADFSAQSCAYTVKAADNSTKSWTIIIESLIK